MKDLPLNLLIVCLLIFSFKFKENLIILENSFLNGAVSVYYDLGGNPYMFIEGYTKRDGTKVKGYYKSIPDKDKYNNWSSEGNINPFTGKKGHKKF